MSKGSNRRPSEVERGKYEGNWESTFNPPPPITPKQEPIKQVLLYHLDKQGNIASNNTGLC